jgi:EAL domain-containing protein (putative c-di-GMP-specific phosphodiesterase class I)/ActR/RegA family two-component response regulator
MGVLQDRLLIIDDDSAFRNYVRRVGESSGFETLVTGDPTAFKERVRSWHPSVIVLDLTMPGSDGVELLRDLVEAKSTARLLIASGADTKVLESVRSLAAQRGLAIAGTLQKPVRAALLKETLERLREIEKPLLASALAHAIRSDDLFLEYQPKLDCRSHQVFGVEALARWHHMTRGILPPDQFIALAEQSGLIHDLTEWVVNAATRQAAAWRKEGLPLEIAINISARNLENIELPDMIGASCAKHNLPAEAVTLELVESAAMGDPTQTMDVLTRLRLKGFRLSIDDFGTGYSSLVQLQKLPFSEIKIDRSFVIQMMRSHDCRVIVEVVIGLAQKLGLCVIAEGVETAEILAAIVAMGADGAQGYFISRPVVADRVEAIVKGALEAR